MLQVSFTTDEIHELGYWRYHHPEPRVQRKYEVLWLKSQCLPHAEIARLAGVATRTVQRVLKEFLEGGLERVQENRYAGAPSELNNHAGSLKQYFEKHPPATVAEARHRGQWNHWPSSSGSRRTRITPSQNGHRVAAGSPTVRTWMPSSLAICDHGTRLLSGLRGVDMWPSLAVRLTHHFRVFRTSPASYQGSNLCSARKSGRTISGWTTPMPGSVRQACRH